MGLIGRGLAVDIDALVTLSRIGSTLAQIGCSANPRQFTSIGHGLAIFANPCPIPIELDWMIAFEFKNSGVLYIWVKSRATSVDKNLNLNTSLTDLHPCL